MANRNPFHRTRSERTRSMRSWIVSSIEDRLGKEADSALSVEVGVPTTFLQEYREERGIAAYRSGTKPKFREPRPRHERVYEDPQGWSAAPDEFDPDTTGSPVKPAGPADN